MWNAASTCIRRRRAAALFAGVVIATAAFPSTADARRDRLAPSPPAAVVVTGATAQQISLAWRPSTDDRVVKGYGLYRDGVRISTTAATAASFGGLSCARDYRLGVDAYDGAGNRSAITWLPATTSACSDALPPTTPTNLVQSGATQTSISLSWTASSDDTGVVGYGLYRQGAAVGTSASPSATFGGLTCGSSVVLGVDAYDAAGRRSAVASVTASTSACPDTSAPTTPTNLAQTTGSATTIALMWAPSLDNVGVAGYGVYRNGILVASTPSWSYTFAGLVCGTAYTLAVDSYDWAGNRSAKASIVASTSPCPDTQPPSAPTGLSPGEVAADRIALAWTASSDNVAVTGYGVYVNGARVATTGATSFLATGLACGTSHTLGVDAFDAAGNRSATTTIAASTLACSAPRSQYPVRGMYDRDFSATGYDHISALGFNFIDSGASRDFTELAARGLKGFVWLGGYDNTTCTFRETDAWVREHVQRVAGNPGVGAYFIDDEPNAALCPTAPSQMRARSELVKSIDPGPPTLLVDYKLEQLKLWAGTVDVIGLDRYPCKVKLNGCDYSIIDQQAAEAERLGVRYWGVVQAWGDDYYKLPTPEELHAQFERWRGTKMEGYLVFAWHYPEDDPASWLANHPELQAQLAVENGVGTPVPPPAPQPAPPPPPPAPAPSSDPVIAAAGDIADDGSGDEATARLLDAVAPSMVLTTGDNVYEDGTVSEFTSYYEPTWGRKKAITRPVPGNHEYHLSGASGYFDYFGSAAGERGKGYYSFDLGSWHLIALNSEISTSAGSTQEQWLRADLRATTKPCVLAYWHRPRFSSGSHGGSTSVGALWQALYEARADVVLNGHDHDYERFGLQNPSGQADSAGIRQFVVGTGGASHSSFSSTIRPNSEARNASTYGVLKLTLHADGYDWSFVPEAGGTFTDSGSTSCH